MQVTAMEISHGPVELPGKTIKLIAMLRHEYCMCSVE
jgi:hypothetical protein